MKKIIRNFDRGLKNKNSGIYDDTGVCREWETGEREGKYVLALNHPKKWIENGNVSFNSLSIFQHINEKMIIYLNLSNSL